MKVSCSHVEVIYFHIAGPIIFTLGCGTGRYLFHQVTPWAAYLNLGFGGALAPWAPPLGSTSEFGFFPEESLCPLLGLPFNWRPFFHPLGFSPSTIVHPGDPLCAWGTLFPSFGARGFCATLRCCSNLPTFIQGARVYPGGTKGVFARSLGSTFHG